MTTEASRSADPVEFRLPPEPRSVSRARHVLMKPATSGVYARRHATIGVAWLSTGDSVRATGAAVLSRRVTPGAPACTLASVRSSCGATLRTKPTTACFVAEYTPSHASPRMPLIDEVFTTSALRCSLPAARSIGIAAR